MNRNYTIPSDNRELQQACEKTECIVYYTIPSDNRELQLKLITLCNGFYYTIPSDNRELQHQNGLHWE